MCPLHEFALIELQYKGLAELQEKYSSKGFDVFAFPCNQVRQRHLLPSHDRRRASPHSHDLLCKTAGKGIGTAAESKRSATCVACLQFGKQEPADSPEVKKFAEGKGFTGPVFAKIDVNGPKGEFRTSCQCDRH